MNDKHHKQQKTNKTNDTIKYLLIKLASFYPKIPKHLPQKSTQHKANNNTYIINVYSICYNLSIV